MQCLRSWRTEQHFSLQMGLQLVSCISRLKLFVLSIVVQIYSAGQKLCEEVDLRVIGSMSEFQQHLDMCSTGAVTREGKLIHFSTKTDSHEDFRSLDHTSRDIFQHLLSQLATNALACHPCRFRSYFPLSHLPILMIIIALNFYSKQWKAEATCLESLSSG